MSIKIGSLIFDPPLFMAPMEGITDVPFRRILRKHGCSVICTQMIHAEGLLRGTQRRMQEVSALDAQEQPVGLQLCGSDPEMVAEAARKAQDLGAAFIDINMGCPAKNIVSLGAGAALLKEPQKAGAIVRKVRQSVSVPVTAKIRAGWNEEYKTALGVGQILEDEGVSLISVHARTKAQKFKGRADWNLFSELKQKIMIPVVGNGDIFFHNDIARMIETTCVDGVMIARGALGNPWIFEGRQPLVKDIRDTILEHLDLHLSFYQVQRAALMTFRKHLVWYTKGLANAAEFRLKVFKEETYEVILEMIHHFFDQLILGSYPAIPYGS